MTSAAISLTGIAAMIALVVIRVNRHRHNVFHDFADSDSRTAALCNLINEGD